MYTPLHQNTAGQGRAGARWGRQMAEPASKQCSKATQVSGSRWMGCAKVGASSSEDHRCTHTTQSAPRGVKQVRAGKAEGSENSASYRPPRFVPKWLEPKWLRNCPKYPPEYPSGESRRPIALSIPSASDLRVFGAAEYPQLVLSSRRERNFL